MHKSVYILLFSLLTIGSALASGGGIQIDSCLIKLNQAKVALASGQIERVPDLLTNECVNGYKKLDRIKAYEYLCQAYLLLDQDKEAEETLSMLLSMNPLYPMRLEHKQKILHFSKLVESFRTYPVFVIGIHGGLTSTRVPELPKKTQIADFAFELEKKIKVLEGFNFEYFLSKNSTLNINFNHTNRSFISRYTFIDAENSLTDYFNLTHIENIIQMPISARMLLVPISRVRPHFGAGLSFDYLYSAKQSRSTIHFDHGVKSTEFRKIDVKDELKTFNLGLYLETGFRYYTSKGFLFTNLSFTRNIFGQRVGSTTDYGKNTYYGDWDNPPFYLKMNMLQWSIGYSYPFYDFKKEKIKTSIPISSWSN